ncbi:MAG: PIN domain-containing protein [Coriobacteriia bacterium]|nr:PIN domain-containing protein [Coriobacteriia bacterium]
MKAKVLLDTNVVLDAMTGQGAGSLAQKIIELAGGDAFSGCLTANSITDIYYLVSRTSSAARAQEILPYLFSLFSVLSVHDSDCYKALDLAWDDFEDALLCVCAEREEVDILITSDQQLLVQQSEVRILSPGDFLKIFDVKSM